ncbi:FG-GAP repeat domain-containing protein, partial [Actinoplanes awajinensis]|uniref:FG-GAP repeat domain-containing protein n=1 Tax=Actinoplanes awajinensis TaxID=135946 RepID=UPI0018DB6740
MNGPRLGRQIGGSQVCCARVIVATTKGRGLHPRAAVIAVTTAITESTLHNYTEAVDHDSLGLFQQRPSQGWGTPAQLTDPVYATNAFLSAMLRKYPNNSWMTGDIGAICQRVQVSAVPDAYAKEAHDAQLLVNALWAPSGSTLTGASADINGDGHVDLLARFPDGNLYVYPGTGQTGTSTFGERYQVGIGWNDATAICVADVSGDGRVDVLARFSDGNLYVYPHTGGTGTST